MPTTLRALKAEARRHVAEGRFAEGLRIVDHILARQPLDDVSRLWVARLLAPLGFRGDAIEAAGTLALHFARAGHPLTGLIAWQLREELGQPSADILSEISRLYAQGAPTLGPKSARQAPVNLDEEIEELSADGTDEALADVTTLATRAKSRALDLAFYAKYPDSYLPIPFLSELPASTLAGVVRACRFRNLDDGQVVIREGERGQSFFLVATGTLRVTKADPKGEIERSRLHEGALFGEMAVLADQPRTASVSVVDEADVLELSREALAELSQQHTSLPAALSAFARERLLKNLLATSPLFRPFDRRQQLDLLRHFEGHDVAPGTLVIQEGQPGQGLFVILSGEVEVTKSQPAEDGTPGELPLSRLRAGDVFGEMSLLSQRPTTASVRTAAPSTLLFLAGAYFQRLIAALPEIRQYFEGMATRRDLENRLILEADPLEIADEDARR